MEFEPDTINVEGLESFMKALKRPPPVSRVGILGSKTYRKPAPGEKAAPATNGTIGAAHEYGAPSKGIPARSFLRIPISDRLQGEMEGSGALSEAETKEVLRVRTVVPWMKKITALCEKIVRGAFDTGGYGKWPGWKSPNYKNNAMQLLVDTTQLRDAQTSEVKENG